MSAITYDKLIGTIFTKARLRNKSDDTGKTPHEIGTIRHDNVNEIDICMKNNNFSLKCFYNGNKNCFYLDIPSKMAPVILEAITKNSEDNPFDDMNEIVEDVPVAVTTETITHEKIDIGIIADDVSVLFSDDMPEPVKQNKPAFDEKVVEDNTSLYREPSEAAKNAFQD